MLGYKSPSSQSHTGDDGIIFCSMENSMSKQTSKVQGHYGSGNKYFLYRENIVLLVSLNYVEY